jgi:hypothetical protein
MERGRALIETIKTVNRPPSFFERDQDSGFRPTKPEGIVIGPGPVVGIVRRAKRQAPTAFTRAASREILREAVFLWMTPWVAARISSGWAA